MATSVEIGRGYVTLFVKDSTYHKAMARAEQRLNDLGKAWTKALGPSRNVNAAVTSLQNLERSADRAAASVRGLTRAYVAMQAAINPAMAPHMAAILAAAGDAEAKIRRAQGAADAARSRGAGSAQASILRGTGAADAAVIRAQGAAAAAVINSVGNAMSRTIRAVGLTFKNTINAAASTLRLAFSPINLLLRGMRRGLGVIMSPAGLLGMLGGGLGIGKIGKEAVDLEARIINLGRVAELSGAKLDKLVTQIKGMGQTMAGVKIDEIFDISTMAAKMGVSGGDLGAFTRDIAKMSVVLEDIPTEEAVQRIGRLISVFGLAHSDAIRFGSALTRLDIESTADARDILDITTRFAGLASAFKMTAADAMALATAIRQSGIPLETGGTATTQIMSRMSSRRDMGAFSKIAGMTRGEFRKGMETDVLGTFTRVLEGMERINSTKGPVALAQAMDRLHLDGQRVRGAFTQLIPVIGTLNEYVKISRNEWESLDAIQKGFELKSRSAKAQLALLANNFKLLAAEVGTGFLPFIKEASDGISLLAIDLQKFFTNNQDNVESWAKAFGESFHKVSVLFREFPTFVDLGVAVAQEKWLQFLELLKRSWELVKFSFTLGKDFLADVIPEIASNLSHRAINAVLDNFKPLAGIFLALGKDIGSGLIKGIISSVGSTVIDNTPLLSGLPGWDLISGKIKKLAGVGDGISLNNFTQKMGEFAGRPAPEITPQWDMIENLKGMASLLFSPALPDKAMEILGLQTKISNAEQKLIKERNDAANAAEREAAALRAKKEAENPSKPKPKRVAPSQQRFNRRKAAANQFLANRRRFNAAFAASNRPRDRFGRLISVSNSRAEARKLQMRRAAQGGPIADFLRGQLSDLGFKIVNPPKEKSEAQKRAEAAAESRREQERIKNEKATGPRGQSALSRFLGNAAARLSLPDVKFADPSLLTSPTPENAKDQVRATDESSAAIKELKDEIVGLKTVITTLQRDGMPTWLRA